MEKKGLSEVEAKRLLEKFGENRLPGGKTRGIFTIIIEQFKDCMVLVLIAAATVSAFLGEFTEAFTVLGIVLANALLGTVQSWRTEKAVAALGEMSAPEARVLRDGSVKKLPAAALVPGDVIILSAGDRVGADGKLFEANSLTCDESMLTGESVPAEKQPEDRVYMGTMVLSGNARACVTATGAATEMGKIAGMLGSAGVEPTPLQQRLKTLGRTLLLCCLFVCAGVSITGYLRGEDLLTMFLSGVSLAVAAIPEGLPAVVTVSLALGVTKMSKRRAMIRRMPAVETLGCVEVICSDKTGTLTENKMKLDKVFVPGEKLCSASELGRSGEEILRAAVLASGAEPEVSGGKITAMGSATEVAVVVAAAERGIYRADMVGYRLEAEHVFTSERKRMSRVYAGAEGRSSWVKGAPELILPRCTAVLKNGKIQPLTEFGRREILKSMGEMAAEGQRVIAVAGKKNLNSASVEAAESGLCFYGLLGLLDPPRREVHAAVREAANAGIRTVMITGDSPETARAIAARVGIFRRGDRVVTGAELDAMSNEALEQVCDSTSVYARVAPSHKFRIVKALKRRGYVTAMTGDGVNDAPAVREADVGVAMGKTGTDVTREAADVVLADDNFVSIVDAVRQGRMIYDNIRKFLRYMLSSNLGEVLTMFAAILLVLPLPLLPVHILLVNLVTDGLPAMALSVDPPDGDVMKRRPRGRAEGVFARGLGINIFLRGLIIAAGTVGVFWLSLGLGEDVARTAAFFTLALSQLIFVFECRSESRGMFSKGILANRWLVGAVLISAGIAAAAVYVPVLQTVFGFETMPREILLLSLGVAFGGAVLSSIATVIIRALGKKEKKKDLLFED